MRRPEIYIFDDNFSALDFKTDAKLRAALKDEVKGATVFMVAQRVSTVMDADKIIVLDEGRVAGWHPPGTAQILRHLPRNRRVAAVRGGIGMKHGPGAGRGPGGGMHVAQKAKNFKGTSKRLLGYLKPHWAKLLTVFFAAILSTAFMIIGPNILKNATNLLVEG